MKKIIYICFFLCLPFYGYGQISTDEEPYSWRISTVASSKPLKKSVSAIEMPALDRDALEKEDKADEENGNPPRFGFRHPVNLDMDNSGIWEETPDGGKLWKLEIRSPDALSLNLLYDKFWLPEGAKFFVYSSDKKNSIGAFTSLNNKGMQNDPKGFATGLIYSNDITLEYYEPKGTYGGIISIAYIVSGYRYIEIGGNNIDREIEKSAAVTNSNDDPYTSCFVNVNCSEGVDWQNEKNAIALIVVDGYRWCSGSLVNNTAEDNTPYFLTADHCLVDPSGDRHTPLNNQELYDWTFYWNYEMPDCDNPSSPEPVVKSTVGATVIAHNDLTDFALLLLTEDPASRCDIIPYYLGWDCRAYSGWDCTSSAPGLGGVCIHHPAGEAKKISTYNVPLYPYSAPRIEFWELNWKETQNGWSIVVGGSSGAPLINNNHYVVGQLSQAAGNCPFAPYGMARFGRFDLSWNTGDNANYQLSNWLDPLGIIPIDSGGVLESMSKICDTATVNNRTITTSQIIESCNIEVAEATVTNNASVTLHGEKEVNIFSDFEVTSGAVLTVQTGCIQ